MEIQKYNVQSQQISTILAWVRSKEIAVPEIQRPFVWDASKVRDFLDSLYKGFPVGYLIGWRNHDVKLKDGTTSDGKKILIDGQQRVTALMAAVLGEKVLTKDYKKTRIVIAFNPLGTDDGRFFEVSNPAIQKNPQWIADVATIFMPEARTSSIIKDYCSRNPDADTNKVEDAIELLRQTLNSNTVGYIELSANLDIETVTEIFIRVNSAGVPLSQADFAMSKIAVNETYGGNQLRKAIEYFCHLAIDPSFYIAIKENDHEFVSSEYFSQMAWLHRVTDNIYDPSYSDMLRVVFATKFRRGKLADLVALLSGRNFETKQYEEEIVKNSFAALKSGVQDFSNQWNFMKFVQILRGIGFVNEYLIGSQNALNFAYILFLTLRESNMPAASIERYVAKWFVFSMLVGRYSSGAPETSIDYDIRKISELGIEEYSKNIFAAELSDGYWQTSLPQNMITSVGSSQYFRVFKAAQIKAGDKGFLSRDITVRDLIELKSDIHHLFPRQYLQDNDFSRGQYNQIANYAVIQSDINIAIGKKEPARYMGEMLEQCSGGKQKYGNIVSMDELRQNLAQHCIPEEFMTMTADSYQEFLEKRRVLMAEKIRDYFLSI